MADFCSIVIPAFNEEENIEPIVRESIGVLEKMTQDGIASDTEIIVIDDASTDKTGDIADRLAQEFSQVVVIHNPENIGCHPSSLVGFRAAQGQYQYFIPGDCQIPPGEFPKFVAKAKEGCDVVYSWRVNRADPPHRVLIGKTYNLIMRTFFGIEVHDVDSSSMLSKKAVDVLLDKIDSDSAFITVEMLLMAHREGLVVGEVEIEHRPRTSGVAKGVNVKDLSLVPLHFLKMVFFFWRRQFFK